jgi:iron complex transport system substrate-binding protein
MKLVKNLLSISLLLLMSISFAFAQGAIEARSESSIVSAKDSFGQEVEVSLPLSSIAIIGKAALMPADALYLFPIAKEIPVTMAKTDQGLGDFFTIVVPKDKATQRLGQQVGAEEILSINPDLILTKSRNKKDLATLISGFDIPLFALDLETMDSWKEEIIQLGKLLNEEQRAQIIVDEINIREERVSNRVKNVSRPSVLVLQGNSNNDVTSFSIAPKEWIQSELVIKAGGEPITLEGSSSGWSTVSFEQIASWDPDYIVIVSYKSKGSPFTDQIYASSEWNELKAVKENSVYLAPSDYVNYFQPNSRWILALQWLASTIHPDLFSDSNMEDEVSSFYTKMYGITDSAVLKQLVNMYNSSLK